MHDCSVAQARTGTGKTIAFLIPVLQNIIGRDRSLEYKPDYVKRRVSPDIRAIIVSPTRELAEQIAVEAKKVTRHTGVIVQTAVGGSAKREGMYKIKNEGCHILVATPGRLNDILSDPYSKISAPKLSAFVMDEADRLLDEGFAPEIEEILSALPKRQDVDRQTLLFSATMPREVMQMVRRNTKPDFKFVRTVQEGEQQTHEKVPQKLVIVGGFANLMPALVELCKREIARESNSPFKAIVYYSTTAEVALASATLENLRNPDTSAFAQHPLYPAKIIEIHARLTQYQRTKAAESFRRASSGILLSSDVTARGMDFPNVTHVIQMCMPQTREAYIHRLGRTARGDKTGEGWLLVVNFEAGEAKSRLQNLPLTLDNSLETAKIDMTKDAQVSESTAKTLTQVIDASKMVPREAKQMAYMSCLGVYNWFRSKQKLVDSINDRAKYCWGMTTMPAVGNALVKKLGLTHVDGLNIGASSYPSDQDRGSPDRYGRSNGTSSGYGGRGRPAYGSSGGGYGSGRSIGQGYGGGDRSYGGSDRSFGGSDRRSGGSDRSFGGGDRRSGGSDRSFGGSDRRYGGSDWSAGGSNRSYETRGTQRTSPYGDRDQAGGYPGRARTERAPPRAGGWDRGEDAY